MSNEKTSFISKFLISVSLFNLRISALEGISSFSKIFHFTSITKSLTANVDTEFSGSTINSFNANDQIGLSIEATDAATISPGPDTSAYINIVKIA